MKSKIQEPQKEEQCNFQTMAWRMRSRWLQTYIFYEHYPQIVTKYIKSTEKSVIKNLVIMNYTT